MVFKTDVFLTALEQVIGTPNPFIPLHEPEFSESAWEKVRDCLDSTFVSSVGRYVDLFERYLTEYTGAKYAVAVVNGTAALQVALTVAGVQPEDEILMPALSFVATANAASHCGAIPHFLDSDSRTLGLDVDALESYLNTIIEVTSQGPRNRYTQRRVGAIVPMHTYGHPVAMDRLLDIANFYSLPVIEDAAEALGSTYQGKHLGTFGLLGILSFNGNKTITTGGGGAILTNASSLAALTKHLTTTAKLPHRWRFFHDCVAWNYRLPNLNAALGCAQMEQLPELLRRKRLLAQRYQDTFRDFSEIDFVAEPENSQSNYWLNTLKLKKPDLINRDRLLTAANDAGYQCRPTWTLLHKLPMYADCPCAPLPIAEQLEASLINVPSSAKLVEARIC
jgi:perosamine synthetase